MRAVVLRNGDEIVRGKVKVGGTAENSLAIPCS